MGPGTRPRRRPAEDACLQGREDTRLPQGTSWLLFATTGDTGKQARGKEKARAAAWPLRKQTALGGWATAWPSNVTIP